MNSLFKHASKSLILISNLKRIPSCLFSSQNFKDPYEELELKDGANVEMVKAAYIRLSKKYHPDTNQHDAKAKDKFINITNAYRKIMENYSTSSRSTESTLKTQQEDLGYSFTLQHLGVETHPIPTIYDHPNFRKLILLTVGFLIFLLIDNFKDSIWVQVYEEPPADEDEKKAQKELRHIERVLHQVKLKDKQFHEKKKELDEIFDKFQVQR